MIFRRFAVFCALSLLLLALVPLLSAATGTSMNFGAVAARASAETGIPWTSNLWNILRLAIAEPGLWLLVLGSSVPTLAAIVTLAIFRDGQRALALIRSFRPTGNATDGATRMAAGYALLFALIVLCLFCTLGLRSILAPGVYVSTIAPSPMAFLIALLAAAFLDQGAVLEEAGWRGYATPLLSGSAMSPLAASLAVGLVWGLWHIPRDVVSGVIERLGVLTYLVAFLPSFVLGTLAVSVVAVYFMNRAGGSLWPAIIAHGLTNDAMGIAGSVTIETALTPAHQITKALPLTLLAVALIAIGGKHLNSGTKTP